MSTSSAGIRNMLKPARRRMASRWSAGAHFERFDDLDAEWLDDGFHGGSSGGCENLSCRLNYRQSRNSATPSSQALPGNSLLARLRLAIHAAGGGSALGEDVEAEPRWHGVPRRSLGCAVCEIGSYRRLCCFCSGFWKARRRSRNPVGFPDISRWLRPSGRYHRSRKSNNPFCTPIGVPALCDPYRGRRKVFAFRYRRRRPAASTAG